MAQKQQSIGLVTYYTLDLYSYSPTRMSCDVGLSQTIYIDFSAE